MDVNIIARRNIAKWTEIITERSGIGRSGEVLKIGPMMKAERRWSVHSVDVQDHLERVTMLSKGVFLVSAKNAFVPVKHDNSVNTYFNCPTRK